MISRTSIRALGDLDEMAAELGLDGAVDLVELPGDAANRNEPHSP